MLNRVGHRMKSSNISAPASHSHPACDLNVWSRDGRELFYTTLPSPDLRVRMMAVPVTAGATFRAGPPRMLFEGQYYSTVMVRSYDVAPDSSRFLMVRDVERPPLKPTNIILVQNWFEELKRLVPMK
jgi:hypothetical protein